MSLPNLKYFNLSLKEDVLVIAFDDPDEKVNTLNLKMTSEFNQIMDLVDNDDKIKATVFTSGKSDNFIVGADIKMIKKSLKQKKTLLKPQKKAINFSNELKGIKSHQSLPSMDLV